MLYKLSRFSKLHNILRRIMNAVLWQLPVGLKYGIGSQLRNVRLPYRLIQEGDVVVQIGAPWDLLRAGRSRAIYFAKRVGSSGHLIVVEPDEVNVNALRSFLKQQAMENVTIVAQGAWSKKTRLRFLIKDDHPASNLIEDVFDENRIDRDKYRSVEIDVDSLDNILSDLKVEKIALLSVTSNGSEEEILDGVKSYLRNIKFISIIREPQNYSVFSEYGFKVIGEDDRGYTFAHEYIGEQKTSGG